jgi:hypothetical protein
VLVVNVCWKFRRCLDDYFGKMDKVRNIPNMVVGFFLGLVNACSWLLSFG